MAELEADDEKLAAAKLTRLRRKCIARGSHIEGVCPRCGQ